jgi:hypothetical protein
MAEDLQLDTVRFSDSGAAEMDQHRQAIFIPRAQITRVEVGYGSGAERPAVVIVLGLALIAVAIGSVVVMVLAIMRGGVRVPVALISAIAFTLPGWWLLDLGLRRRPFIRVHTHNGDTRKLVFHKVRDRESVDVFLQSVRQRFGYS